MKVFMCFTALFATASAMSCSSLSVVNSLDIPKFAGVWYKQYGLSSLWDTGSCVKTTYTYNQATGVVKVTNTVQTFFGGLDITKGSAVLTNPSSTEGKFNLTIGIPLLGDITVPLWVLSTDYENFAVVMSCSEISLEILTIPFESVWVVTKSQTLTEEVAALIKKAMATIHEQGGPSMEELSVTSQKHCS